MVGRAGMGRRKRRASGAGEGGDDEGAGGASSPTPAKRTRPEGERGEKRRKKDTEKKRERASAAAEVEAAIDGGGEGGSPPAAARPRGRAFASVEDFELAVASTPGSSYLWIKYMAFALSLADVGRARAVGEAALAAIPFRDVGERFNVWLARLNLELSFGGPGDAEALLGEALQRNDRKKMLVAATGIWEGAGEAFRGKAEALHLDACREFKRSAKVWLGRCGFHMRSGQAGAARAVLGEAVAALPRRKHVKVVSKFAILEFRHGSEERGRTLFEGLVRAHPRRTDLWGLYVAQERRLLRGIEGRAEEGAGRAAERGRHRCRALYERATDLEGLSSKKAKALFKQYLDFEVSHAPLAEAQLRVDAVKRKAAAFIEKSLALK